ncbi:STAS domain-containing protein [Streptomyces sp. NPDC006285]|uniref:STAS domain-containing protein n=1 Tax=Streptomyces sp. NPDC006285 TaxID=3364742 RepID=UPI00368992B8
MTDTQEPDPLRHLSVTHTTVDGVQVVTLRGEIDQNVNDACLKALLPAGDGATPWRIVADLSGVTFMDSTGINTFITAHQAATSTGGWLRITGAQEPVQRVLMIVGLDQLIDCHPTLTQALNS